MTRSHPEIGKSGRIRVSRYQLFVEREGVNLSLDLPPTVTEFEVPAGVTALGKEFKFEIIVRTQLTELCGSPRSGAEARFAAARPSTLLGAP